MQAQPPPDPPPPTGTILYCNCRQLCDGVLQIINDRRKWNRHAKYREGPAEFFERRRMDAAAQAAQAGGSAPRAPAQPVPPSMRPPAAPARAPVPPVHAPVALAEQGGRIPGIASVRAPSHEPHTLSPMDVEHPVPPVPAPVGQAPLMAHDDDPPEPPLPLADELAQPPVNGYSEDVDMPMHARHREVAEAQAFIRAMQTVTLDGSGLSGETIACLRAPPHHVATITDGERAALRMFLARGDASEDNYTDNRAAMTELHPEDEHTVPTYEQVKRLIANVTGIDALIHDMCINSCVAFTGPFAAEPDCPTCGEPRYEQEDGPRGRKVLRRTFHTYPLGPQIQAMYASPENARLMQHRAERTSQIRAQLRADPTSVEALDDVYWGNDYLGAVGHGEIKTDNSVVMMSLDGAQLYESKTSDCWFYVWVLYDLPLTSRYKKRYVLPGGVIGGLKKLKNVDSFLFPGLYHVAALQRNSLKIWDAAREQEF
ncbi:hypothetical protein TRAPUB_10961 [Trametes pubescens]|uniref:Uncharacterized protein n=1 Tax=Trametes pubescens TaxID=154538 RepID=A0A1M2VXZ4_TRAPU|nr:hypothetical protein TRAPUB_10961 [Trametes pubescens]